MPYYDYDVTGPDVVLTTVGRRAAAPSLAHAILSRVKSVQRFEIGVDAYGLRYCQITVKQFASYTAADAQAELAAIEAELNPDHPTNLLATWNATPPEQRRSFKVVNDHEAA